jgi:hypothetical protein
MYDPNVFNISDNTMIQLITQSEDYLIDRKHDVINWFKIRGEYDHEYQKKAEEMGISLDDNTCVINFRGGEYRGIPSLILRREYWLDSVKYMRRINPDMKFIIITDDIQAAKLFVSPEFPCYHIDIGFDFYIVNKAKYLILANSSFSWWAGWLNENSILTIAPKYWARHNISNGYWSLGDQYVRSFVYMGRDGLLYDYESCKKDAIQFYKNNGLL